MNLPENKKIILFDGICNLCNAWIRFLIKHDTNDVFRYVSIQSNLGQQIIEMLEIDVSKTDSIILYEKEKNYYIKSKAIFKITKTLGRFFLILNLFSIIPKFITDYIYELIAKNRYKWFGKKDFCSIPNKENLSKFL